MNNQAPPKTVRLTLSPSEGRRLFGFLTELAECGDTETDFSGLDALLDKVGDANALALWLRENVNVEIAGPEVAKVREVLERVSPEKSATPEADMVLSCIHDKPAEYLPGGRRAANIH